MSGRIWVNCTVADLRAKPDDRAERVSQLLLFSQCELLDKAPGWQKVRGPDGYEGWLKESLVSKDELPEPQWKVWSPVATVREVGTNRVLGRMALDTRFFGYEQGEVVHVPWAKGRVGWVAKDALKPASWTGTRQDLLSLAEELLGVPYLWGGTSPFGFDCSGYVQRLFHVVFNMWLPRDSCDQKKCGTRVPRLQYLAPGDLLFFPGHVGLWLGDGYMIHASGRDGQIAILRLQPPEGSHAVDLVSKFLWGARL